MLVFVFFSVILCDSQCLLSEPQCNFLSQRTTEENAQKATERIFMNNQVNFQNQKYQ